MDRIPLKAPTATSSTIRVKEQTERTTPKRTGRGTNLQQIVCSVDSLRDATAKRRKFSTDTPYSTITSLFWLVESSPALFSATALPVHRSLSVNSPAYFVSDVSTCCVRFTRNRQHAQRSRVGSLQLSSVIAAINTGWNHEGMLGLTKMTIRGGKRTAFKRSRRGIIFLIKSLIVLLTLCAMHWRTNDMFQPSAGRLRWMRCRIRVG